MASKVVIYEVRDHKRSRIVCDAMAAGIARHGENVCRKFEHEYINVEGEVAVFYGLGGRLPRVFREYSQTSKAAYIDLGYWGRKDGNRWAGYHKISINDRHPTAYFQNRKHDGLRSRTFKLRINHWRKAQEKDHILLAGMGDKGAIAEGYEPEEWEQWAIKTIRDYTKRTIIYRPKPSWKRSKPIGGVGFSKEKPTQDKIKGLEKALENCCAVVTHHSNVAVDGILKGIPAFVWKGVATPMGSQDLSLIEAPPIPGDREQWVNDISYCQWNIDEMRKGVAWAALREEGLV